MGAAVTLVALPVAALVLLTLLRSPKLAARLVAVPTGERWHEQTTPTFGGVGIAAGLAAALLAALAVGALEPSRELAGIVAACMLVFVAGVIDDVAHLSPIAKLAAQIGAAAIVIAAGLRVQLIDNDIVGIAVALVWLVGMTNAFNLLDNMDGLAATLATIACAYFAIDAATVHENDLVLVLSLSLAFACAGFLPLNLRPGGNARVFMGDGGSQLLGFLLGALGLAASWTAAGTTIATMALPLLVLAIPILDTTLVTIRRLLERRPVTQGGRDHTSHRLVYYGLSEAKAVGLLASIAIVLGASGVAYNVLDRPALTAVGILLTGVLLVQFGAFLGELDEHARAGRPGDTRLRHAVTIEPRRLLEVVGDFALTCGAFFLAYVIVVGGAGSNNQKGTFLAALPILLGVRYVAFIGLLVYRRAWRYAIPRDYTTLVVACVASEVGAWALVEATRRLGDFPARVFLVDVALVTPLICAARLGQRWLPQARVGGAAGRAIVVGAGAPGRGLARALRSSGVAVVGFVDDDPRLERRRVLGIPVVGPTADLDHAIATLDADRVALPDGSAEHVISVVRAACATTGARLVGGGLE